jgi:hypothetical protein
MPANNDPIFTKSGDVTKDASTGMAAAITLAANDFTGAGANNVLVFTADATNGSFLQRLRVKSIGTNVASVLRVFINNGATNATATNNTFFGEIALPATTTSAVAPVTPDFDYPMNVVLPAGFKVYVGLATAVAAGWVVTPVAGKY